MKRKLRFSARFLIMAYLLTLLSPLAPLLVFSPAGITGECVGDCALCGCTPQASASRTCCCWIQKQQLRLDQDQDVEEECCKKKREGRSKLILSCGFPCGGSKHPAGDQETAKQLPSRFCLIIRSFPSGIPAATAGMGPAQRFTPPPDPPPEAAAAA